MESRSLLFLLSAGLLVWRKPEKESLAFRLVITSIILMIGLFLLATRGSILPGLNY